MSDESEDIAKDDNNEAAPVSQGDDLSEFLKSYNKPLTVNDVGADAATSAAQDAMTDKGIGDGWKGNPNYYQSGKKRGQPKAGKEYKDEMTLTGDLMDGAMFITLIDMIFPMVICMANNSMSQVKIEPDALMLSEKQKKQLEPICEQVVKKLSVKADPITLLCISLFTMYGVSFYSIRNEVRQEMKDNGTLKTKNKK